MRYRLAIFDFDGTLADSFPWFMAVVNDCADRYRFRRIEPHEVDTLRGYEARRMVAHLGVPPWKLPLIARYMRRRMAAEIGTVALFPGVDRLLRELADAGIHIGIVTTNSVENVRRVLGPENAALVHHWACGGSLFGKAPLLRRVLRASGVPAAQAISIGDEIRDLRASRAERIPFGAVGWGFTTLDGLRAHAPDEVFETLDQLAARLTGDAHPPPHRLA